MSEKKPEEAKKVLRTPTEEDYYAVITLAENFCGDVLRMVQQEKILTDVDANFKEEFLKRLAMVGGASLKILEVTDLVTEAKGKRLLAKREKLKELKAAVAAEKKS